MKLTGHTYALQHMKKHLQKPELTNFAAIWQKDILTLDGLEKGQLGP